jgi:hypothetical protein
MSSINPFNPVSLMCTIHFIDVCGSYFCCFLENIFFYHFFSRQMSSISPFNPVSMMCTLHFIDVYGSYFCCCFLENFFFDFFPPKIDLIRTSIALIADEGRTTSPKKKFFPQKNKKQIKT